MATVARFARIVFSFLPQERADARKNDEISYQVLNKMAGKNGGKQITRSNPK